jgi:hypothetical protein
MQRPRTGASALFLMLFLLGCAEPAPTEDQQIAEFLAGRGYDPQAISYRGDRVYVAQDASIARARILAEMARSGQSAGGSGPQLVEKGYYRGGGVANALNVSYSFIGDVPQRLRDALAEAAARWSGPTDCIDIDAANTGHNFEVSMQPLGGGFAGSADSGFSTLLGQNMQFDPTWLAGAPDAEVRSAALHEVGHILGFQHPWQGQHIAGTAMRGACDGNGPGCRPSYVSVMDYFERETALSLDDKLMAVVTYGVEPPCTNPNP